MEALNVMENWQLWANPSQQMFNVFAFGFDTRIKTISLLIKWSMTLCSTQLTPVHDVSSGTLAECLYDASHWPWNASFPGNLTDSFVCPWCTLLTEHQITDCINILSSMWCVRSATARLSICCAGFSFFFQKIIQTAQTPSLLWKLLN